MLEMTFQKILETGREGGAGSKFIRMSERYADGAWQSGVSKLQLFSRPFDGGTVLVFGSKFGHTAPLFQSLGAGQVINVDVDDEYLRDGERFIAPLTGARYVKSDDCYLDLESGVVDFVLMKEVISHINPALLYTCFAEVARVLKAGGEVVISDGNNLDKPEVAEGLQRLYCEWDHGSSTDLGSNYRAMRGKIIAKAFRSLTPEEVAYYARNTAGLYGERLIETVRRGIEGRFVERPHRQGAVPIHPSYGTSMERGFTASGVIEMLGEHGIRAEQLENSVDVALVVRGYLTAN